MKTVLTGITACLLLLAAGCKKDEDGVPNSFSIAGKSYAVSKWTTSLNGISLVHNEGASNGTIVTIYFGNSFSAPAPGVYKIVSRATASDHATISAGLLTDSTTTVYGSTNSSGTTVTLTTEGSKYRVILPPTIVQDVSGTRTVMVSADAVEP